MDVESSGSGSDEDLQRAMLESLQGHGYLPGEPRSDGAAQTFYAAPLSAPACSSTDSSFSRIDEQLATAAREMLKLGVDMIPQEVLDDLQTLFGNLVEDAGLGSRYRRVRTSNARIRRLLATPGIRGMVHAVGFKSVDDGEFLEIPPLLNASEVEAVAVRATACVCSVREQLTRTRSSAEDRDLTDNDSLALKARRNDDEENGLRKALAGRDAAAICDAYHRAQAMEDCDPVLLLEAKTCMQKLSEEMLRNALQLGNDLEELVKAVSMATAFGVQNEALLANAQRRLSRAGQENELRRALSAHAFSNSGTQRHRVLAPLLSKILSQHDIPSTMLEFIPQKSRAFSLEPAIYGSRGGRPYFKPVGWLRFSVRRADFHRYKDWCIAYHGTKSEHATRIIAEGLRGPDSISRVAHGQVGGTGRTIYLSPSIEYAAHPVYSQLVMMGQDHWAQLVLECRVAPGCFREQGRTLGAGHWPWNLPFDNYFSHAAPFELLVEDPQAVVVSGLMVREFGRGAAVHSSMYGEVACKVSRGSSGVEYEWNRLRAAQLSQSWAATPAMPGWQGPVPALGWPGMLPPVVQTRQASLPQTVV